MTDAGAADTVRAWFARVKLATLELPEGWFGRPWDNLHQLTWVEERPHKLLIELDSQLYLAFSEPHRVMAGEHSLIVESSQFVFDWQEYGTMTPHTKVLKDGKATFLAQ